MSNQKRIVVATAWIVSVLLMVASAFGQTQDSKKQKRKGASVAPIANPAPSNDSASTIQKSVPGIAPLILFRNRTRSVSAAAQSRTVTSGNAAIGQVPSVALDSQSISAGILGEKATSTLPAPSVPVSTSNAPTTSSTSYKGLSAPSAPKPVH